MCQIPEHFLTSDLVHHPRSDKSKFGYLKPKRQFTKTWTHARFLVVFEKGDLNTAAHCLAENMHEPFEPFPIACVAVQQSVRDDFVERLRSRFHQVKPHVATHPHFERSIYELFRGGIKYVVASNENAPANASPILVTDNISHLYFGSCPSGVVTIKTFDTVREAADIFIGETPTFDAVHVFDESISSVYALAARISCVQYYVNCFDVCTMPILPYYGMRQPRALLHNGYHYETVELGNVFKIIVFPYTTSFVRRCCCPAGQCTCHIQHKVCCD